MWDARSERLTTALVPHLLPERVQLGHDSSSQCLDELEYWFLTMCVYSVNYLTSLS